MSRVSSPRIFTRSRRNSASSRCSLTAAGDDVDGVGGVVVAVDKDAAVVMVVVVVVVVVVMLAISPCPAHPSRRPDSNILSRSVIS